MSTALVPLAVSNRHRGLTRPRWLTRSRLVIIAAVVAAIAGTWLGWPGLVAAGVAPILLSLAPCAAMCALGLCMSGMARRSSATADQSHDADGPRLSDGRTAPALTRSSDIDCPSCEGGSEPIIPHRQAAPRVKYRPEETRS